MGQVLARLLGAFGRSLPDERETRRFERRERVVSTLLAGRDARGADLPEPVSPSRRATPSDPRGRHTRPSAPRRGGPVLVPRPLDSGYEAFAPSRQGLHAPDSGPPVQRIRGTL